MRDLGGFLPAFGRSAPFVWLLVLPVVLITYLVMRRRPSSFLKRQLTCAVGIQTLSLLVPMVVLVATIVAGSGFVALLAGATAVRAFRAAR